MWIFDIELSAELSLSVISRTPFRAKLWPKKLPGVIVYEIRN